MFRGLFLYALLLFLLSACASNRYLNSPGHGAFLAGNYESAAQLFESEISKSKDNRLLFLLDTGTSFFNARQFEKAIPFFLQAVKFWESKDYTSVREEVAKLAISENLKTYIGEDYERVLIHVFLALSYAGIGKTEDAQVEARRIDFLLKQMREKEKKPYSESAFARWLSALLWESTGNFDSARIDYESAFKIDANFPGIRQDMLRSSQLSGDSARYEQWKKRFPGELRPKIDTKQSELIVFVTAGASPVKVPQSGDATALPQLFPRPWSEPRVEVSVGHSSQKASRLQTVLNLEDLTRKFFNEKLAWLSARKLINLGIRGGIAYAVGRYTKSPELGWLSFVALSAMDTTDLRGWNTLPAVVNLIRVPVQPGYHDVKIDVMGAGSTILQKIELKDLQFLSGKKYFVVLHAG